MKIVNESSKGLEVGLAEQGTPLQPGSLLLLREANQLSQRQCLHRHTHLCHSIHQSSVLVALCEMDMLTMCSTMVSTTIFAQRHTPIHLNLTWAVLSAHGTAKCWLQHGGCTGIYIKLQRSQDCRGASRLGLTAPLTSTEVASSAKRPKRGLPRIATQ